VQSSDQLVLGSLAGLPWLCVLQDAIDSLGHSNKPNLVYIKAGVY